jgi:hypothetical protein
MISDVLAIKEDYVDRRVHPRLTVASPPQARRADAPGQDIAKRTVADRTREDHAVRPSMLEKTARGLRMETSELHEEPRIWREGNEVRVVLRTPLVSRTRSGMSFSRY